MHAQRLHMLPETRTRLCFCSQAGECIDQRPVFRRFLIEELVEPACGSEWESNNIEKKNEWKCDDPPECFEEITHVCQCYLPWWEQLAMCLRECVSAHSTET